ncbi:MAG: prepilin-type N-terminal cleavage/methylation domain-containing protein [Egibacteraceae bacterium]
MTVEHDREAGFSLMELVVVVLIIGVLAAITIPALASQRRRAIEATLQSDLRGLVIVAESYYAQRETYDGFEAEPDFPGFTPSDGVTVTLAPASSTASNYCIAATHLRAPGLVWSVRTNPAPGTRGFAPIACP